MNAPFSVGHEDRRTGRENGSNMHQKSGGEAHLV